MIAKFTKLSALALILTALLLLCGCADKRADTRQQMRTIGIVITNEHSHTYNELYVFKAGEVHEWGPDAIKNTKDLIRVGSFGITVEQLDAYDVVLRDEDGGVYRFESVPFYNGDNGIIGYDGALTLTVHHFGGGTEVIDGQYIAPGDAPRPAPDSLKKTSALQV